MRREKERQLHQQNLTDSHLSRGPIEDKTFYRYPIIPTGLSDRNLFQHPTDNQQVGRVKDLEMPFND